MQLLPQEKFSMDAKVVQIHRYYILLTVFKENWSIQDTKISKITHFFLPLCKKKNKSQEVYYSCNEISEEKCQILMHTVETVLPRNKAQKC